MAVAIKTPAYYKTDFEDQVKVSIQLLRPSDGAVSQPKAFTYLPLIQGLRQLFIYCNLYSPRVVEMETIKEQLFTWNTSYSTLGPVSAWMGDSLRAGKLSRHVTSHPGQLSLAIPPWLGELSTSLGWEGNRRSVVALAVRHRQ